mmetsp:Transcript_4932/g.13962  ORF Transcript_4932/g.13962 Transcript_4932/m.13962 type:complete len:258 (+) Transcript_4932:145-918(+)
MPLSISALSSKSSRLSRLIDSLARLRTVCATIAELRPFFSFFTIFLTLRFPPPAPIMAHGGIIMPPGKAGICGAKVSKSFSALASPALSWHCLKMSRASLAAASAASRPSLSSLRAWAKIRREEASPDRSLDSLNRTRALCEAATAPSLSRSARSTTPSKYEARACRSERPVRCASATASAMFCTHLLALSFSARSPPAPSLSSLITSSRASAARISMYTWSVLWPSFCAPFPAASAALAASLASPWPLSMWRRAMW